MNVLSVMDGAAEKIRFLAEKAGVSHPASELIEARAAVAELIEQRDTLLNALKRALPHVEHAYHTHEDLDGSFWIDVVGCRNALARAQGVQS